MKDSDHDSRDSRKDRGYATIYDHTEPVESYVGLLRVSNVMFTGTQSQHRTPRRRMKVPLPLVDSTCGTFLID